jgi:hypothetical protein
VQRDELGPPGLDGHDPRAVLTLPDDRTFGYIVGHHRCIRVVDGHVILRLAVNALIIGSWARRKCIGKVKFAHCARCAGGAALLISYARDRTAG